jgi:hypothetical protein
MIELRRVQINLETVFHEFGPVRSEPLIRGAIGALLTNPFAGRYVDDILPMMEELKPLGLDLAHRLLDAMGVEPKAIEGYGKGAIIGAEGELEHGALWHVPGGYAMRELLEAHHVPTNAIVPSCKKVGAPGARLDIPITHVNASYVRSHFDAIEVGLAGAPKGGEMIVFLAMTTGARVHARVGGLKKADIVGRDGLR